MTREQYIEVKAEVSGQELLDMFREVDENGEPENETVRLEINEDGEGHFMNDNSYGYNDTILTQTFERYDWLEDVNDEVDINYWVDALNSCYHNEFFDIEIDGHYEENEDGEEELVREYFRVLISFY